MTDPNPSPTYGLVLLVLGAALCLGSVYGFALHLLTQALVKSSPEVTAPLDLMGFPR